MLRAWVLGPVEVAVDGRSPVSAPKQRSLLAALIAAGGEPGGGLSSPSRSAPAPAG